MRRFFFIGIAIVLFGLFWGIAQLKAPSAQGSTVVFEVVSGQGVNTISAHLKQAGLIKNSFAFETLLWLMRSERQVRAGRYSLSTGDNVLQQITQLISGVDRKSNRVTFIEGWTLREYRDYLADRGFDVVDFDRLVSDAAAWHTTYSFLGGVSLSQSLEGYLFPDTYAVAVDKDARALIVKMLDNFDAKVSEKLRSDIITQGKNLNDAIILASILEREVTSTADRKKVANIFYNRLKIGMALQSDATINYLTGSGRTRSTAKDLSIDSAYNTYKYRGLPPGPIGNPGLDAITAAVYPTKNDYLYFLTSKDGTVYYARNLEEHKKNRELYL